MPVDLDAPAGVGPPRDGVVSRLLSALGPFGAHIESVAVRLQTSTGHSQPNTTISMRSRGLRATDEGLSGRSYGSTGTLTRSNQRE